MIAWLRSRLADLAADARAPGVFRIMADRLVNVIDRRPWMATYDPDDDNEWKVKR